ncbi:MAG: hypothetical protein R3F02_09455 [Thiolinea sp.]
MHSDPLHRIVPALALIAGLTLITTARADTQLTYIDSGISGEARTVLIQIKGNKVRMGEVNSPVYSLFDHEQQTLLTINQQTRQYIDSGREKTLQRTQKVADMQKVMQAQMLAQLPNMPEQQRQAVQNSLQQTEAMLKAPAPQITQQASGETLTIQGIECRVQTLSYNGVPGRSVCNADPASMDKADYQTLLNMFDFMDSISVETAKINGFTATPESTAKLHKPGLALQIKALPQGPASELGAISTAPLDEALFTLPEGYQLFEPMDTLPDPSAGQTPQQ